MDPALWPISTRHDHSGRVCIGDVSLEEIADQYGTPTYVVDEADVRHRCRTYREIFPDSEIVYAGKALMIRAMATWVSDEGLGVDVCSAGELAIALAAGVDPKRIILHGNAKSVSELRAAVNAGVGRIVLDSPSEAVRLASVCTHRQKVLIRVTPGIDIHGHKAVSTGVLDQSSAYRHFPKNWYVRYPSSPTRRTCNSSACIVISAPRSPIPNSSAPRSRR
ncbi:hypothetical protein GCM10020255_092480 [Rhodococcus baikonurensis]